MSSVFDLDTFVQSTTDEPLATRMIPVPEGEYLLAVASHDKWCEVRSITEGKMAGRVIADLQFEVLDESVKQALSMDTVRVRKSYFLDLTPDGRVDFGPNKNIQLGKLREALGQNKPGVPFGALKGAGPVKGRITQRPDSNDPTIVYNDIAAITSV